MPELPEVEGVVRDLKPLVEGKTIERVMLSEVVYNAAELGKQCIVKNANPAEFELVVSNIFSFTFQKTKSHSYSLAISGCQVPGLL